MRLDLITKEIQDPWVREDFVRIAKYIKAQALLISEFEFFEIEIKSAVTNYKYKHNLNYKPLDVMVTSLIGPGVPQFNFTQFDTDFLDITTTDAVTIRAFIGAYRGGV